MSTSTTTATNALSRLDAVPQAPPDPILGVSEAFRADTSPQRLNLGVGAYRTEELKPWVLPVVVEAERRMLAAGNDKEYLPIEGFAPFNAATARLLLGDGSPALSEKRCATIQCLSGTGSLRIGADFIAKFLPRGTKVFVSDPTWGNHFNIFGDAGLECGKYRYFDAKTVGLDFEGMIADLDSVPKGSVIVLHGRMVFFLPLFVFGLFFLQKHKSSEQVRRPVALLKPPMPEETRKQSNRCDIGMDWESYWPAQEILSNSARQSMKRPPTFFPHFLFAHSKTLKKKKKTQGCAHNPTGVDPTRDQWAAIADACDRNGHLPFFDVAYQGFASGSLDDDAWAPRFFAHERGLEILVAQSYSKNLGLYAERVGALNFVLSDAGAAARALSQAKRIARAIISNPPVHGARIAAEVVGDPLLFAQWKDEMRTMADRIRSVRGLLQSELEKASDAKDWSFVTRQIGMFSFTGLTPAQVERMTGEHHIYMTKDGRISLAGLSAAKAPYLAAAIADCVKNA